MRTVRQLAWLAGLIEGEGSFCNGVTPTIQIQMTDADIILRAADILGVQPRNPWRSKLGNRQLVHHVTICGSRAIGWMMTLYTLMGERRQLKIKEILSNWRALSRLPRAPRGQRWMATCHPNKPRTGKGLCRTCYMRKWRKNGRNGNYYRLKKIAEAALIA